MFIISKPPFAYHILGTLVVSTIYSLAFVDVNPTIAITLALLQTGISLSAIMLFAITRGFRSFEFPYLAVLLFGGWTVFVFFIQILAHGGNHLPELIAYFINGCFFFIVLPILTLRYSEVLNLIFDFLIWACIFLALFSVLSLFSTSFLGLPFYVKDHYAVFGGFPAVAGLYEHPSHVAILFSYGTIASFFRFYTGHGRRRLHALIALAMCLLGIFLSQGRVGIISIALLSPFCMTILVYRGRGNFLYAAFFFLMFLSFVVLSAFVLYSDSILTFLRVSQGSSGRFGAWQFAALLILENPILGYGANSPSLITMQNEEVLRFFYRSQIHGVGFHNSFIDTAIEFGVVPLIWLIIIFLLSFSLPLFSRHFLRGLLLSMSLVSLLGVSFGGMSLGGIRLHSFLYTFFVGLSLMIGGSQQASTAAAGS